MICKSLRRMESLERCVVRCDVLVLVLILDETFEDIVVAIRSMPVVLLTFGVY